MSDVDRDQLPESRPLMLQQLCLLRPHIPAGQAHFALITCADLRAGRALGEETYSYLTFFIFFCRYERKHGDADRKGQLQMLGEKTWAPESTVT